METGKEVVKTSIYSLIGNFLLALVKFFSGYFGHSYALIADAIESTTDVFSSLMILLGLRYAHKPADENHPYGHGKIEPLITFLIVVFLIVSATIIAYESILHILTPHKSPAPWTLLVLGLIIVWKEIAYRLVLKKGKETNSSVLQAEAWHHRSDAISSVTAFVGISIALIFGKGYETADDWAALVASVLIYYNSFLIFRPALGEILDENRYDDLIQEIRVWAKEVDGILDTEKCLIRKNGTQYHVDLHAIVDGKISVKAGHDLAHKLKDHLMEANPNLADILIHIEPNE
ncbi:cation diffusion facilitator family transporter [Marinilongibacter aquaticus]|uniref:cation diffusion facilitator family transporter n=1 Tax=Marinilongibacter aquaticus TaxID=2975157 RepID=UPI0021BD6F6E|nr:cation diffusion facilitator family transporter [Marinilongibacter aquaticus]UBM59715.1 cation diffusion facilitator family transporter [Marinilongibacter aquaticus]